MPKVDNAVILAAGTSSRFAPLSYEFPKALIPVKGEILIERQIKQLRFAGIHDIYVVTGYKAELFQYLTKKYNVILRYNPDYNVRNNNSSIKAVEDILKNTYICSADNYFVQNPFESIVDNAYYAAVYSPESTNEWCIQADDNDVIQSVSIGGYKSWYMLGHTFWDQKFSDTFRHILDDEYDLPATADKLWEDIYIEHLNKLHMKIRKYPMEFIFEFDTLDELRKFDTSYIDNTRSTILKKVSMQLHIHEGDLKKITCIKNTHNNKAIGFSFEALNQKFTYYYDSGLQI